MYKILFFFFGFENHQNQESFGEFCDQFVDVNDDIVNARSNRRLWLEHPSHKLVKRFRIRRTLWSSVWPFYLSVHDCELKTSTGFSKCIFERRHSVPAKDNKSIHQNLPSIIVLILQRIICITLLRIMCSLVTRYLFSHRYLHGSGNPRARELETVLNNVQMSIPIKAEKNMKNFCKDKKLE